MRHIASHRTKFRRVMRGVILVAQGFLVAQASAAFAAPTPPPSNSAGNNPASGAGSVPLAALPRPAMPLRIIGKDQFCGKISQILANFGSANGYDKVQSTLLASGATSRILSDFKTGRATDFVNAPALLASVQLPPKAVAGYLPVADLVGKAMGLTQPVTLALSAGELRFIPNMQQGSDLVVVASNAAAVTPERAQKVAEVARNLKIRVNILWVGASGEERQDIEEARVLAWVAASTGGSFANLGGADSPCTPAS